MGEILVGQFLGLVGIFLLVAVFQVDDRRKILHLQIASCLTWAAYYAIMDAWTAAGLIFLGAIRCYLFDRYRDYDWLLGAFILAYALATTFVWEDWTSVMAFVGMTLATIAIWQKEPHRIRLISLVVTPFWLTYNMLNGSLLGAIADLVTFSSVVIGVYRFDIQLYITRWKQHRVKETIETNMI